MDDVLEIDLRNIIRNLLVNWKWIVGFALLAGIAAFLFSYLQPRTFSANALVAITKPRYLPNFDEQYQTVNNTPPTSNAIIALATSDEIVQDLYSRWQGLAKETITPTQFLERYLVASPGNDPAIVVLSVKADTAEEAASLANTWAQNTTSRANQLFSGTDGTHVENFKAQIDSVKQSLTVVEAALSDFESRDQISILSTQLSSLLAQQADYLRKQRLIETTISDANGLVDQLDGQAGRDSIPNALQTNLLALQLRIYNDPNLVSSTTHVDTITNSETNSDATPLQIEVSNQSSGIPITLPDQSAIQTITKAEFASQVKAWTDTLKVQSDDIQANYAQLSGQITALQKQIQDLSNERDRLTLDYKNTQAVYSSLLLKYAEVKITSNDLYGNTQIASAASPPSKADSRNTARNIVIALIAGGLIAMIGVLAIKWWKSSD